MPNIGSRSTSDNFRYSMKNATFRMMIRKTITPIIQMFIALLENYPTLLNGTRLVRIFIARRMWQKSQATNAYVCAAPRSPVVNQLKK